MNCNTMFVLNTPIIACTSSGNVLWETGYDEFYFYWSVSVVTSVTSVVKLVVNIQNKWENDVNSISVFHLILNFNF